MKKEYNWNVFSCGFKVKVNAKNRKWLNMFEKCLAEERECQAHRLNYGLFESIYRLYRRGKNRCVRCGVNK